MQYISFLFVTRTILKAIVAMLRAIEDPFTDEFIDAIEFIWAVVVKQGKQLHAMENGGFF